MAMTNEEKTETEEDKHWRLLSRAVAAISDMLSRAREAVGCSSEEADQWERQFLEILSPDDRTQAAEEGRYRVVEFPGYAESEPESPFRGDAVIAALEKLELRYVNRHFPDVIAGAVETLRQLFGAGPIRQADARSVMEPAHQVSRWLSDEQIRLNGGKPKGEIPKGTPYPVDYLALGDGKPLPLMSNWFRRVEGKQAIACPKACPILPIELVEKLRSRLGELAEPGTDPPVLLIGNDQSPWYVGNQTSPEAICWCAHSGAPKPECLGTQKGLEPTPPVGTSPSDSKGTTVEPVEVTLQPPRIQLDGVWHNLTETQAIWLDELLKQPGNWMSTSEFKVLRPEVSEFVRPDRLKKVLPPEVLRHLETQKSRGTRWVSEVKTA